MKLSEIGRSYHCATSWSWPKQCFFSISWQTFVNALQS